MIAGSFGPYLAQSTHDHEMGTEADLEPSISVVLWGRAEQFVAVRAAARARAAGSTGAGSGSRRWRAGSPGAGCEVLGSGRRGDLQSPQRLAGADEESVRQPGGQQHEIPGPGVEGLAVAAELRGAGQQVEHLVLVQVPVQRRGRNRPGGRTRRP